MVDPGAATAWQRTAALAVLLTAGLLSLPVAAFALDGERTENFIVPAQLAGMLVVGAVTGRALPGLAGSGASRGRAAGVGALLGVATALLGVVLFFVVISGFDGA